MNNIEKLKEYNSNNIIYGTYNEDKVLYRNITHSIIDFIELEQDIYVILEFNMKNKISKLLEININELGMESFYMKILWNNKTPYINIYKK